MLVSRKDLLKKVWGGTSVSRDGVYQHISVLRKVLGESRNDNKYIMTVPRGGYQFVARVEIITPMEQGGGDLSNEDTEVVTVESDGDYVNPIQTVDATSLDFHHTETIDAGSVDFVSSTETVDASDLEEDDI